MNALTEIIRREVELSGFISFARFMKLSLYCPEFGYYEQLTNNPGRRGDFYTSVSVGNLFGELLAFQFARWFDQTELFHVLEAGAHDGRLALDILNWFEARRPGLLNRLDYWIVEPSARRQQWQKRTLARFNARVRWFDSWEKLPAPGVRGIIFSNELLDAMPIHRFGWNAREKKWFEWAVDWEAGNFVWKKRPVTPATQATEHRSPAGRRELAPVRDGAAPEPDAPVTRFALDAMQWERLRDVLPDDFTTEHSAAAVAWWSKAASALERGHLLTFDYGLTAEEFFLPHRANGTLRAYHRHRLNPDVLAYVGEQDLTAHVNFTALQHAAELAGLRSEGLISQTEFLTRVAEATWTPEAEFGEWTANRKRQFHTLTHPEHLGRSFKVLWQSRLPRQVS